MGRARTSDGGGHAADHGASCSAAPAHIHSLIIAVSGAARGGATGAAEVPTGGVAIPCPAGRAIPGRPRPSTARPARERPTEAAKPVEASATRRVAPKPRRVTGAVHRRRIAEPNAPPAGPGCEVPSPSIV
ncbi:MAG TPA: hypothetical protein VKU88_07240 [Acidimicrobiales bacterium]|nr:hypothetical protein [Acidimicrobiales bacterium]